jgi:hypothetical protein
MDIPQSVKNYNFPLVANALGQAAADIGARIVAMPDVERSRTARVRMANLLVQLGLAFTGEQGVRNSGLLHSTHPAAGPAMSAVSETEKRVRAVTRAAVELGTAAGSNIARAKENLVVAVDELRAYLAKPLPGGRTLFAGGPEIPSPAVPKVATGARR